MHSGFGARVGWLLASLVAVLTSACDANPDSDAQVLDGTTGKPLAGVYVIATWDIWTPMPVESHTSCGKVEVTRTDANGHFVVSEHARGILVRVFGSEVRHLWFSAPGLRVEDDAPSRDKHRASMRPDTQPTVRRLKDLNELA